MRTTIELDDKLLQKAKRLTGIKTNNELVHEALRLLVKTNRRRSLLDVLGKVELNAAYNHKTFR